MIYKLVKLPVSKLSAQMPTSEIACNKLAMRLPPGIIIEMAHTHFSLDFLYALFIFLPLLLTEPGKGPELQ